jgi:hypothetical protein
MNIKVNDTYTNTQVKTTPRAARGNNAEARGKITDCRRNTTTGFGTEKQDAPIKHLRERIEI